MPSCGFTFACGCRVYIVLVGGATLRSLTFQNPFPILCVPPSALFTSLLFVFVESYYLFSETYYLFSDFSLLQIWYLRLFARSFSLFHALFELRSLRPYSSRFSRRCKSPLAVRPAGTVSRAAGSGGALLNISI